MAKIVRDQGAGPERGQERHGEVHAALPDALPNPAFFLRQLVGFFDWKPVVDFAHAPDDKEHCEKRQLKGNVTDHRGPNQSDQQRRQRQTGEHLFLAIEHYGQFVNADHDCGAHRRHHRAGESGVKHHGDE